MGAGRRSPAVASVLLFGLLAAAAASAQDTAQPILTAQFSFSNPGARSLGFAGAFVALADDATAAWANPAGLVQITRPEVSMEIRHWRYSTPYITGGRVRGEPIGLGLDTTAGLLTDRDPYDVTGLAFLSFVYPSNRWSMAVYRHILANLEVYSETGGLFTDNQYGQPVRFFDQQNRSKLDVISYGFSAAYRISDAVSIGLGLVCYDTSITIDSDLYLWDDLENPAGSATTFIPEHFVVGQSLYADNSSLAFSAGLLWKISPSWNLGGRYRQGPTAALSGSFRVGSIVDVGTPPRFESEFDVEGEGHLPHNYGLGVAYRSTAERLTVAFEWDRVTYSDPLESIGVDDQGIDDADQLHLGAEWVFLETQPVLAIRAGLWHDPDHMTAANESANDHTRALLRPGEDQLHYALGVGLAFTNFQLDAAVDLADTVDTFSLSLIYSF